MRRAFQRCSASLSRSLPSLTSTNARTAQQTLRRAERPSAANTTFRSGLVIRKFHQSSARSEPITKFAELETQNLVHPNVVRTLTKNMGLETMTDVQSRTINEALKGTDIIAQAKTGTGKTLAFLLPVLQRILNTDPDLATRTGGRRGPRTTADDIRGLIISPTRELAEQIAEEAKRITQNTGVIVQTAVGGTAKSAGLRAIQQQGCHLLVGTPGRLKDILSDPYSKVQAPDLNALVLDEADRLLDQGFWVEIQEIMRLLPTIKEKDRQTLMFSATVPREVVGLVRQTLKPGFEFVKCVQDDEQPTHERVPQKLVKVNGFENSLPSLIELCQRGIATSQEAGGRPFKAIVYFNATAEVALAKSTFEGLTVGGEREDAFGSVGRSNAFGRTRIYEIHAKLTQQQRTRSADSFRNCESGILLSSDVTARGMDFPNVTHVIQMGLPTSREQYVHRIGRTGRAGKEGEGWLLINQLEVYETQSRLRGLPLVPEDSLIIPKLDLTQAADVPASAGKILSMYQKAIQRVPMVEKSKVYLAQLGIFQWVRAKQTLIQGMNNLTRFGWGLKDPPNLSPMLAQRLGLMNTPGVNIGHQYEDDGASRGGFGGRQGGGFGGRSDGGRSGSYGERSGGYGGRSGGYGGGGRSEGRFDSRGGGGRSDGRFDSRGVGGGRRRFDRDGGYGRRPVENDPFA